MGLRWLSTEESPQIVVANVSAGSRPPEPSAMARARLSDGSVIVVRRHGNPDGPRVVFTHGCGFAADLYWPFWSLFADEFDVVVYDLRSHGWNETDRSAVAQHADARRRQPIRVLEAVDNTFGAKPTVGDLPLAVDDGRVDARAASRRRSLRWCCSIRLSTLPERAWTRWRQSVKGSRSLPAGGSDDSSHLTNSLAMLESRARVLAGARSRHWRCSPRSRCARRPTVVTSCGARPSTRRSCSSGTSATRCRPWTSSTTSRSPSRSSGPTRPCEVLVPAVDGPEHPLGAGL